MIISFLYNLIRIVIIIVLPFGILIRGSLYLHYDKLFSTYSAIMFSGIFASLVLLVYIFYLFGSNQKIHNSGNYLKRRFTISALIVGSFVFYAITFISPENTKGSEVKKEFYNLHPTLRLACSTLFLLDRKAIITDASRLPEDYKKMGLKTRKQSLHYKQKDGYSYALDLRTNNRSHLRNSLLRGYFYVLGFNTLRHVGTDDHLHISMPCRYNRTAI